MRVRSTSRRRTTAAAAALALALLPAAPGAADARRVRVFAMQPKLDLAWMQSRRTFHDKMLAVADRRLRGAPGVPIVQRGADDFASHLRRDGRNLVLWPEDIGLFAALTGQRAAPARTSGSLEGAIVTLIGLYPQQNSYYGGKYPAVAARPVPVRLLTLALTDTFAHVALETFSQMARRYHVWLEAGIDMAQGWKVVCDDRQAFNSAKPPRLSTGERCREQNPSKVDELGDPFDPGRDFVYEATTPKTSNMALVFDPRGWLVSRQVKEYITPIELPGQLDLVPGRIDTGLSALRTPVGTLGFVTSKDAWMPDVQARLDEAHVDLLAQPEFFVGDTATDAHRMWAPDTMLGSGYSNALKLPSIETMIEPDLVGNIFNFTADQQSFIALKPRGSRGLGHLVGEPDHPGLTGVMPWIVRDPLTAGESVPHRRERVAAAGRKLLPGSGVQCPDPRRPGPCENGHVEGVLWRDVTVGRHPRRRVYRGPRVDTKPFGRSRAVHPSSHPQRNAAVAMRGRRGVVAFEERRGGHDQIVLARTSDRGRTWSRAVHPTGRRSGTADEQWPAVASGPNRRVTLAWNDDSTGVQRIYFARTRGRGLRFGPPHPLDPRPPRGVAQWRAALAQGRHGPVHAAFVDTRLRSADDALPQAHVYYARIRRGVAERARRLDTGAPVTLAGKLDNSWAPRLAVRGRRVLAAWVDFLNYDWGVFSRGSLDGGSHFGTQVRVTDNREDDPQQEELADSPDPVLGSGQPLVVWSDWRKRDSTGPRPHPGYDIYAATPGRPNSQVDPYGRRQVSTFAPSACPVGRTALVAFQDAGAGRTRIALVRVTGGRRRGAALRVDDGGPRAGNAWRPRLACSGERVLAAFESERDGPGQVYVATANVRSVRLDRRRTASK